MISIYKNYDTSSLVLDKPCVVDGIGTFYPVRVKDYIEMQEYGSFLIYNKKYFGLKKDEELLEMVIMANTMSICKDINNEKLFNNSLILVLDKMCNLFSLATRQTIKWDYLGGQYLFTNEDSSIMITQYNFSLVRKIIAMQNLFKDALVFEDKETEKWFYKYKKSQMRGKKVIDFDDILLTVIENMKYTFEYINELSIFQLYALYSKSVHVSNYETISKYRCVGEVKSNIQYTDGVIVDLYKQETLSDALMDESEMTSMF